MQKLSEMAMTCMIRNLRALLTFNRYQKDKTNVFVSLRPRLKGGGSNTFASLMVGWLKKSGYLRVSSPHNADIIILIANRGNYEEIEKAKEKGAFILHRLDEHFEDNEIGVRKEKHEQIVRLNKLADLTIFQSKFVFENVYPYIKPRHYRIVLNGSDPKQFYPSGVPGKYVGNVVWGMGEKKRMDLLYRFIQEHPEIEFCLAGNHYKYPYNFRLPNVRVLNSLNRKQMARYYRSLKMLYFPSENDPCPNTAVEAIMSGVPVCFNPLGGTKEIVSNCGVPLDRVEYLLDNLNEFRARCLKRRDLFFDSVAKKYLEPLRDE